MTTLAHSLKIGSQLYWSDSPSVLAGTVIGFTAKRDVIINFVSGNEIGVCNYPIFVAKKFIVK